MDKVLIVEDDLKLQRFLSARLQKQNDKLHIILAGNGEEAIRVLEQEDISLLVTDIQMPKVDGLTLLAYMNDKHPDTPCIAMTAHATPEVQERASKGAFRFFQKPFQLEELFQAILRALEHDIPSGALRGISVASFLQMIALEQKTCLLEVASAEGDKGFMYFECGELHNAVYRGEKGEAAALEMIALDKARIRFRNLPEKKIPQGIKTELMTLIVESVRRKDEAGRGESSSSDQECYRPF